MGLAVTVLGSSAMYASVERAASGYLLDLNGTHLWMDAGGGTWRNLLSCCDYRKLGGIVLTHRHPDHTIDVFQAFHARAYGDAEPLEPIPLWAPAETLKHLNGFSNDLIKAFTPVALDETSVLDIAGARLTFTSMAHPAETLGVRVESDSGVLAYSATPDRVEISEGSRRMQTFSSARQRSRTQMANGRVICGPHRPRQLQRRWGRGRSCSHTSLMTEI